MFIKSHFGSDPEIEQIRDPVVHNKSQGKTWRPSGFNGIDRIKARGNKPVRVFYLIGSGMQSYEKPITKFALIVVGIIFIDPPFLLRQACFTDADNHQSERNYFRAV